MDWFPTLRRLPHLHLADLRIDWRLPSLWPLYTTPVQRQSLLRLLAVATEENLPLAPLVAQWAEDERGVQQRRLRRLAKLLSDGHSLPDAVEEIPGVLRDEDALAIRFDAQSGTRTAAMRQMIDQSQAAAISPASRVRQTVGYLCVIAPIAFLIVTFLQVRIMPVYQKIFQEFGLRLPGATHWSMGLASVFVQYWWIGPLALLALLWTMFSTRAGRFVRYSLVNRFVKPLRDLHAAEVLQNLGVAMRAGRPVPGALSTLARYHFDPDIRHKLLFVRNEVEQGEDVWRSMTNVGLLAPAEVRLLEAAERVGNRPWALAQIVGVKKRRTHRRFGWLAELLLPSLVLLLGLFVLLQALAIFQPLITLLEGLS
jgi:type II secretory pathway component PulF